MEKGMVLPGYGNPEPVPVPERTHDHIITGLPIPVSLLIDHVNGADDNHDTTLLQPKFFTVCALEGITVEGAEWDILREVRKGLQDGWSEDAVMLAMRDLEKSESKTLRSSEWAKEDGLWRFCDCIYVPMIPDLRRRIAEQHHDSRIAGHAG
jgi:hypothetical protein